MLACTENQQGLVTYTPPELRSPIAYKGQAELKPVGGDDAEEVERELERYESATRRVPCDLCAPDGHCNIEKACAESVDDAGAAHPGVRIRRWRSIVCEIQRPTKLCFVRKS